MKTIGITGSIASGKSTVTKLLIEKGYPVVDADVGAKHIMTTKNIINKEIMKFFGNEFFFSTGELNRAKLAHLIFRDRGKREILNKITHPHIIAWLLAEKTKYSSENKALLFMDIPLLYEVKCQFIVDAIIVVHVTPNIQLKRLMRRNNLTLIEAEERINSQYCLDKKKEIADFQVDNNGTFEETNIQVEAVLKKILLL